MADVAQHQVSGGLGGELPRQRRPERAAGAGDDDDPSGIGHAGPVLVGVYGVRCTGRYSNGMSPGLDELLEMHRRMLLIRGFEQRVSQLFRDGEVPGFVHLSIGQEAAAVGACRRSVPPTSSRPRIAATGTVWQKAWTRSGCSPN